MIQCLHWWKQISDPRDCSTFVQNRITVPLRSRLFERLQVLDEFSSTFTIQREQFQRAFYVDEDVFKIGKILQQVYTTKIFFIDGFPFKSPIKQLTSASPKSSKHLNENVCKEKHKRFNKTWNAIRSWKDRLDIEGIQIPVSQHLFQHCLHVRKYDNKCNIYCIDVRPAELEKNVTGAERISIQGRKWFRFWWRKRTCWMGNWECRALHPDPMNRIMVKINITEVLL